MLGKTNGLNPVNTGLSSGDLVCWYWGRRAAGSYDVPNYNVGVGYNKDYLSYNSGVFTVLKDFTATVKIVGSGTRNGTSGAEGSFPLTYQFRVGSTTVSTNDITYTGNGTPSAFTYSFSTGNTFYIRGYHTINTYTVDMGFFISIV